MTHTRLHAWVSGQVQGVGFRLWTREQAQRLALRGYARNHADGRVEVVAEGERASCEALLTALRGPDAPGRVRAVTHRWADAGGGEEGFGVG